MLMNPNNFQDISKELAKCRNQGDLRLDLSKTQLTLLPASIRDVSKVQELYLYGNKLMSLPSEIGFLTDLQTLALNENSLQTLPDTLANMNKLAVLDLRHNKLNEVGAQCVRCQTSWTILDFVVKFLC